MYTNLNLVFVLLFRWLPESVQDIVRASTFLILVVVSTIWVSGDLVRTYDELVDSFISTQSTRRFALPRVMRIGIAAMGDILLPVFPIYMIGLPRMGSSFLFAFGILSAWYATARNRIHEIYAPSIQGRKADYGMITAGIVAVGSYLVRIPSARKESEPTAVEPPEPPLPFE